ncbi:uncharacterized protein LOC109789771 [Cajanus cajan]|nr:uncharacterized protein LOC109789771 [Cajanus cajan]XP_029125347.1 uncharacterized protein LOC109789771 [Cajanus cajan]
MENNCSDAPKRRQSQTPSPIDPFQIIKTRGNLGMKLVDSGKKIVKNPSLGNIDVEGASSTLSNTESQSCGGTTFPTQTELGARKGTARSNLYEICAANHWKPPIFECCKEEGPSHKRMFTFKVIIEIEASRNIIECYGAPHRRKKEAAEHAAEGALLYLKVYRACFEKPTNK